MPSEINARKRSASDKVQYFTESVIRDMTRQALACDAVNLAQGFPDFPAPEVIKRAAQEAIAADINQYAITWGAKRLRDAIARKYQRVQGLTFDPGNRDHRLLRLDRVDDRLTSGHLRSRR